MKKNRILIVMICLFLFTSSVSQINAETVLDDGPDDIWKITYTSDTWTADQGDYHDEIDFVSITKLTAGSDVIIQLNMGSTPVIDNYHGYYGTATVTLSIFTATITFWAGAPNDTSSYFNIYIPGLSVNIEFNDTAEIDLTNLNFVTTADAWSFGELNMPDIDSWDLHVFTFYSTQGWQDSWSSGEAYWDFYPDADSPYSENATNTEPPTQLTTEKADYNISPGFSLVESTLTLAIMTSVILLFRKSRKK
ncbi:MAG: hypothetical protein ACTSP4_11055 [Candidatus Hodarchaeales archaeon]